jgi:oligogalacturonide transport system substrate-binding protein
MKVFTKRIISGLLAATMAGSLAACAPKKPVEPTTAGNTEPAVTTEAALAEALDPDKKYEIRFSWWGGDSRHAATQAAIDAFMVKYPNITVKGEYGAWDGWAEKVATQLNGGTAPDLLQTNWNWLYQFSSDGSKFADLNQFKNVISLQNYDEKVLEKGVVAGKLQGLPLGVTGKAFFWNASTFEKAGLEVPKTFDDIMKAGTVFKEKLGDDYYPLAMYEYERMILMEYYLQSKYGKEWAVDNKLNYSVEEVKEGLDWINSLEAAHVLPSIAQLKGDGATILEKNTKWMNGHYAGFYEWDSAQTKLANALEPGQNFVLGEFPLDLGTFKAGLTKVNMCLSIPESSQNKAAAALLMEFLTSDSEGVQISKTERGMLANSVANKILEEKDLLKGLTYDANKAILKIANFSIDPNFENSALKDTTGVYYEVMEGLSGGQSSEEMAQYLVDSITDVYAANAY